MNTQSIDEVRLEAEADAVLAGLVDEAAPVEGQAGPEGQAGQGGSMVPFAHSVMPLVALVAVPQWNLTADERRELAQSLGECLDQLFPGGLEGKYACWVRLFMTCGGIAAGRILQHGHLPAFGPKKPEKVSDGAASTATAGAH